MDETLRLYLESALRLTIGSEPATLTDRQLVGVVGMLQSLPVSYADWLDKTKLGDATEKTPVEDLDPGKLNDQFCEHIRLMGLQSNG